MDGKKASILCILKILEEYSDEEHFLTHQQIIDKLSSTYGIELERKSVAASIAILEELGYDINKSAKGGVAIFDRLFDKSEVSFLTDAVFSSKAIPGSQAKALSKKIYSVLSDNDKKNFVGIHKAEDVTRTDFNNVFYNIEIINEAISKGKWVEFQYRTFDDQGKPCFRMNNYKYHVCPHFLINDFGHYYMIGVRSNYNDPGAYRLDLIENITIFEDRKVKPLPQGFSITEYVNSHIYLFSGQNSEITIKILEGSSIQTIKDWFGETAKIVSKPDGLYAYIKTSEMGFFYWYMQYFKKFTIISPTSLIDKVKEATEYLTNLYR